MLTAPAASRGGRDAGARGSELNENARVVVSIKDNQILLTDTDKKGPDAVRSFSYDHAFWSTVPTDPHFATQEDVFQAVGMDVLSNGTFPAKRAVLHTLRELGLTTVRPRGPTRWRCSARGLQRVHLCVRPDRLRQVFQHDGLRGQQGCHPTPV